MKRADLTPRQEKAAAIVSGQGVWPIWWTLLGVLAFVMLMLTIFAADEPGGISAWWPGAVLMATPIGVAAPLGWAYKNSPPNGVWVRCSCAYMNNGHCHQITKAYNELNKDNQPIVLPLVRWVYEYRHKKDSFGEYMFIDECQMRLDAVRKVLDEQKKLDYYVPDVDNSDVFAVEEYAETMAAARKELMGPKAIEVKAPKYPEPTAVQAQAAKAKVALDWRRGRETPEYIKYWATKARI